MTTRIVRIHSNWKATPEEGPVGWDYDLDARVLLVGPSGAGKSRVPEALLLALTGEIPFILGRETVRAPKMLWRGAPVGAEGTDAGLFAEVVLSDGRILRWSSKKATAKKIDWTIANLDAQGVPGDATDIGKAGPGAAAIGVKELRDHLFGAPAAAEKWLIKAYTASKFAASPGLASIRTSKAGGNASSNHFISLPRLLSKSPPTKLSNSLQRRSGDRARHAWVNSFPGGCHAGRPWKAIRNIFSAVFKFFAET